MATGSRKGSAGSRGSRGSGGPRGTLGTLLRTTLAQAGVVRDVLERGAREGRARLDDARRVRRRDQALIRLGEAVLEATRTGAEETQGLFELPDVADALAELDGLDAGAEEPLSDSGDGDDDDRGEARSSVWIPPGIRERFDRRPPRPPPIEPRTDEDGTVSSKTWKPPAPRPAAEPPAPKERVRKTLEEPGARVQEQAPARKGGIQFTRDDDDHDEDLAQYMHPDDVPPKPGK